jgi:formate hydrogenlyase subunit 5
MTQSTKEDAHHLSVSMRERTIEELSSEVIELSHGEPTGRRLLDLWASETNNEVNCLSGDGTDLAWNRFNLGEATTYPSVGQLNPAALWFEREMTRTSRIQPVRIYEEHERADDEESHRIEGRGVFTIPFGPVRSGVVEAFLYEVTTAGEDMLLVTLVPGYKRREMESALRSVPLDQTPLVAERISGVYSVAGALVVCQAIEAATETEVSLQAAAIRTVVAELERIFNHCDSIMKLCDDASLSVGMAQMGMLKERVLRLLAELTGHRFGRGIVKLGGVTRGIDRDDLLRGLEQFSREHSKVRRLLLSTGSFLDRLERTGRLSPEDAILLGASGPVARGSRLPWDVRVERPYAAYAEFPIGLATKSDCDAMARTEVRFSEIETSLDFCRRVAETIDVTRVDTPAPIAAHPGQHGVSSVEAPEGEWIVSLEMGQDGLRTCRVRPASILNFACFPRACEGWVLTDFAFIEHSFGLSIAGRDR